MSIRKCCVGLAMLGASLLAASAASAHDHGTTCRLGNGDGRVKHVIYLQFDNTHFNRDRPNVASDLEQMPHLLNVLRGQGTLFTNDHTILISHTAGGILSSLTGLYPNRTGQTVTNSYGFFRPDGSVGFTSAFKYWTDQVDATSDPLPNMVSDGQKTAPAPWVPYTRAALVRHAGTARRLGAAYEQLNASFGEFALATLKASTTAVTSTDDATYNRIEGRIARLTARRDRLASRIKAELEAAAFADRPLDPLRAKRQIRRAERIIERAAELAASS